MGWGAYGASPAGPGFGMPRGAGSGSRTARGASWATAGGTSATRSNGSGGRRFDRGPGFIGRNYISSIDGTATCDGVTWRGAVASSAAAAVVWDGAPRIRDHPVGRDWLIADRTGSLDAGGIGPACMLPAQRGPSLRHGRPARRGFRDGADGTAPAMPPVSWRRHAAGVSRRDATGLRSRFCGAHQPSFQACSS
jgi:hypothetical protein